MTVRSFSARQWLVIVRREILQRALLADRYLRVLIVGIPFVYVLLLALSWNHVGSRDLDQFLVFHELQYWNRALFGFAKQWTPLLCSGVSLADEPQVPLASLSMMLAYLTEPLRGIELAILVYLAWGWVGAYLYAGLCTHVRMQRLLAASLFIGNGFFICRLGYGHIDFVPFMILPSVLWALHRVCEQTSQADARRLPFILLAVCLIAAAMSLAVDGSPVSIIHLVFWIGCYALALSVVKRSALPVLAFGLAAAAALVLDAGYLWPMLVAQVHFPRRLPDSFTNPLTLPWFMLLPIRGKEILPATGNGHELSVFIGPVIAIAIWRCRQHLLTSVPETMRIPLLVVSIVSIWLGMGSLRAIHVPAWLSLFDALRPLPGFRSIGVTGRFWGFLALPLSLFGAIALERFARSLSDTRSLHRWLLFALLLQFGFQIQTIVVNGLPGRDYVAPVPEAWFDSASDRIQYVHHGKHLQGNFIALRQGVIDCYDNDDFVRANMRPGSQLVQTAQTLATDAAPRVTAHFVTWNLIRVTAASQTASAPAQARIQIVLNQSYHRFWRSEHCDISASAHGNLVADCDAAPLSHGSIELLFHDPLSSLGARVTAIAWWIWGGVVLVLSALQWAFVGRHRGLSLQ